MARQTTEADPTNEVVCVFKHYNPGSLLVDIRTADDRFPLTTAAIPYSCIVGGKPEGLNRLDKITLRIARWLCEREGISNAVPRR